MYDYTQTAPKGTKENPYDLLIPRWMADRIEADEGISAQEYASKFFRYEVKVTIVEPLP